MTSPSLQTLTSKGKPKKKAGLHDPRKNLSQLWKPGVSGNPKGRPKGIVDNKTLIFKQIRNKALAQFENMVDVLLEKGLQGEGWAQKQYYEVCRWFLPKNINEPTILLETEDISLKGQLKALTEGLGELNEVTQTEALERLKTYNVMKTNELIESVVPLRQNREEILNHLEKLIEQREEEENKDISIQA